MVRILADPDSEYIEYSAEYDETQPRIKKGMKGKINIILPNGQYHVEILDEKGDVIVENSWRKDKDEAEQRMKKPISERVDLSRYPKTFETFEPKRETPIKVTEKFKDLVEDRKIETNEEEEKIL